MLDIASDSNSYSLPCSLVLYPTVAPTVVVRSALSHPSVGVPPTPYGTRGESSRCPVRGGIGRDKDPCAPLPDGGGVGCFARSAGIRDRKGGWSMGDAIGPRVRKALGH